MLMQDRNLRRPAGKRVPALLGGPQGSVTAIDPVCWVPASPSRPRCGASWLFLSSGRAGCSEGAGQSLRSCDLSDHVDSRPNALVWKVLLCSVTVLGRHSLEGCQCRDPPTPVS